MTRPAGPAARRRCRRAGSSAIRGGPRLADGERSLSDAAVLALLSDGRTTSATADAVPARLVCLRRKRKFVGFPRCRIVPGIDHASPHVVRPRRRSLRHLRAPLGLHQGAGWERRSRPAPKQRQLRAWSRSRCARSGSRGERRVSRSANRRGMRKALRRTCGVEVVLDGRLSFSARRPRRDRPVDHGRASCRSIPTTMGWFERDWYLGLPAQLFDTSATPGRPCGRDSGSSGAAPDRHRRGSFLQMLRIDREEARPRRSAWPVTSNQVQGSLAAVEGTAGSQSTTRPISRCQTVRGPSVGFASPLVGPGRSAAELGGAGSFLEHASQDALLAAAAARARY